MNVFRGLRNFVAGIRSAHGLTKVFRDPRKTMAFCEAELQKQPDNDLLRRYLAEALDKTHQRKRAAAVRHEILERRPNDFDALRGLADFYAERGDVTLACEAMRRAMDTSPPDGRLPRWLPRRFRERVDAVWERMIRDQERWKRHAREYLEFHGAGESAADVIN